MDSPVIIVVIVGKASCWASCGWSASCEWSASCGASCGASCWVMRVVEVVRIVLVRIVIVRIGEIISDGRRLRKLPVAVSDFGVEPPAFYLTSLHLYNKKYENYLLNRVFN